MRFVVFSYALLFGLTSIAYDLESVFHLTQWMTNDKSVGTLKSEVIKTGQATRRASVSSASASNRPPEHVR